MFDYLANWMSINHQNGDGGQFELYRKGEWLTKEIVITIITGWGSPRSIQYPCSSELVRRWHAKPQWYEAGMWANGSQWMEGDDAGDPTTITSNGPGYVYAASDLTKLYNRPDVWDAAAGVTDILQATRSILWLNNDYIVVYDRATSIHPGFSNGSI